MDRPISTWFLGYTCPDETSDFINLLKICWSSNTYFFRDEFYTFPGDIGLPIGSPSGSLIAEVIMHKFEYGLFLSPFTLSVYWHRYIDDVLCLRSGNIFARAALLSKWLEPTQPKSSHPVIALDASTYEKDTQGLRINPIIL